MPSNSRACENPGDSLPYSLTETLNPELSPPHTRSDHAVVDLRKKMTTTPGVHGGLSLFRALLITMFT